MTGGVDGLACVFDCSVLSDEEAALSGVLSIGSSVARLGFCGALGERLWAATGTEELAVWRWADGDRCGSLPETRAAAAAAAATCPEAAAALCAGEDTVDYLVRCEWDAPGQTLWLLAGTQGGAVAAFPVADPAGIDAPLRLGPPAVLLAGGHADVVRAVEMRLQRGVARAGALTGGEDSRLCAWALPQAEPAAVAMEEAPPAHGAARRSASSDSARFSPY